jgi:hypothetical protein
MTANPLKRPAKMHKAFKSMMEELWPLAEDIAEKCTESKPEPSWNDIFSLISKHLLNITKSAWIDIGLRFGSLIMKDGADALQYFNFDAFKEKGDIQNFMKLRPAYAVQALEELFTNGGPLETRLRPGTPPHAIVNFVISNKSQVLATLFQLDMSLLDDDWVQCWVEAFTEFSSNSKDLGNTYKAIIEKIHGKILNTKVAHVCADDSQTTSAANPSSACDSPPGEPDAAVRNFTLLDISRYVGDSVAADPELQDLGLCPVVKLLAASFSVGLIHAICLDIEQYLLNLCSDRSTLSSVSARVSKNSMQLSARYSADFKLVFGGLVRPCAPNGTTKLLLTMLVFGKLCIQVCVVGEKLPDHVIVPAWLVPIKKSAADTKSSGEDPDGNSGPTLEHYVEETVCPLSPETVKAGKLEALRTETTAQVFVAINLWQLRFREDLAASADDVIQLGREKAANSCFFPPLRKERARGAKRVSLVRSPRPCLHLRSLRSRSHLLACPVFCMTLAAATQQPSRLIRKLVCLVMTSATC